MGKGIKDEKWLEVKPVSPLTIGKRADIPTIDDSPYIDECHLEFDPDLTAYLFGIYQRSDGSFDILKEDDCEKEWFKSRLERLSDIARGGYVLSNKECEAVKEALNKKFGCLNESTEFKNDLIVKAVLDERNMIKKEGE